MSLRIIAHLDMDAFFASVEEAMTPSFKGKPIVVGTEPNNGTARGVVSTANYKAREYGIHSAMPISFAWRLSEEAKNKGKEGVIFLPVDMELYSKVSQNILRIIKKYSDNVEQGSIDEFYFDLSFAKTLKKAESICQKIKKDIKNQERITCSVGLGSNKLVSKIAADTNKPDGMTIIEEKGVQDFLNVLDIEELPGIGPKTAEFFHKKNIKIIKDLSVFSKEELHEMLGKSGESIYYKSRGIDEDPIIEEREVKSIGEQVTFDANSLEAIYICEEFNKLSDSVFKKFVESGFRAFKNMTVTIRFSDFETKTSSKGFKDAITLGDKKKFELELLRLILPFLDRRSNPKSKSIRLIGVRIEKLAN